MQFKFDSHIHLIMLPLLNQHHLLLNNHNQWVPLLSETIKIDICRTPNRHEWINYFRCKGRPTFTLFSFFQTKKKKRWILLFLSGIWACKLPKRNHIWFLTLIPQYGTLIPRPKKKAIPLFQLFKSHPPRLKPRLFRHVTRKQNPILVG